MDEGKSNIDSTVNDVICAKIFNVIVFEWE